LNVFDDFEDDLGMTNEQPVRNRLGEEGMK
jgi:hypothetical protein